MSNQEFIKKVAAVAVADWLERRVMIPSVVIAQCIKESNNGTSELAVNANALCGIKLNGWTGKTYRKKADEQNLDGSMRVDEDTLWRAYDSWEESIIDHNTYIAERKVGRQATPNFKAAIGETNVKKVIAALIGNANREKVAERCTDPELKQYVLESTTQYGYATDFGYAQSLLDDYIIKYNLTQYDTIEESDKVVKVAIDAGHGLYTAGKRCLKSLDAKETREWFLNDRIADKLQSLLKAYNCEVLRVDDTTGLTDVSLANRVKKANNWGADIYISIHHNAGLNGKSGGGTMVFYYSSKEERKAQAQALYDSLVGETGLVGNRASKIKSYGYYVIKNTNMPAFLIENGFMDSLTDIPIILTNNHADKSAQGLLNFLVSELGLTKVTTTQPAAEADTMYRVQCGAFKNKANAEALKKQLIKSGFEAVIVHGG